MEDITILVKMLINDGNPLISQNVLDSALKNYASEMLASRAMGGCVLMIDILKQVNFLMRIPSDIAVIRVNRYFLTKKWSLCNYTFGCYCIYHKKYDDERYDVVIKFREEIHNM